MFLMRSWFLGCPTIYGLITSNDLDPVIGALFTKTLWGFNWFGWEYGFKDLTCFLVNIPLDVRGTAYCVMNRGWRLISGLVLVSRWICVWGA